MLMIYLLFSKNKFSSYIYTQNLFLTRTKSQTHKLYINPEIIDGKLKLTFFQQLFSTYSYIIIHPSTHTYKPNLI